MKIIHRLFILLIVFSGALYSSQVTKSLNKNKEFANQFFMNKNVFRALEKYAQNKNIFIMDSDKKIIDKPLSYNNNGLKINIIPEKREEYDFYLKKVIINKDLAFIVLWYKDNTTALCFYPFKSQYTPNTWLVEEITTRSIK